MKRLSTEGRAGSGLLAGLAALGCALAGCRARSPDTFVLPAPSSKPEAEPGAVDPPPPPAPPVTPDLSPARSAAPTLPLAVDGVYRLPSATTVAPIASTATTFVFVAADGTTRVGATASFADARPITSLAGLVAEASCDQPPSMLGRVGEEQPSGGYGLGGGGDSEGDPSALGQVGLGRGSLGSERLGRAYVITAVRAAVGVPSTVLVIDQGASLAAGGPRVVELGGAVTLAVAGGGPGASALRLVVTSCSPYTGSRSTGLTGEQRFAELVGWLDGEARFATSLGVVIEVAAAPGPMVRAGAPTPSGGLDKDIIRRLVKRNLGAIKRCYEQELERQPELAGKLTVTFVIGKNGAVASSQGDGLDPTVASCVAGVILRIVFPAPTGGGSVTVNYPFVFAPGT